MEIGKSFRLTKRLGSGAFGEIFLGINTKTNTEVAIKIEKQSSPVPQLLQEAEIYKKLLGDANYTDQGIPHVYYVASESDYNYMVNNKLAIIYLKQYLNTIFHILFVNRQWISQEKAQKIIFVFAKKNFHLKLPLCWAYKCLREFNLYTQKEQYIEMQSLIIFQWEQTTNQLNYLQQILVLQKEFLKIIDISPTEKIKLQQVQPGTHHQIHIQVQNNQEEMIWSV
ncbi:Protein kinase-like domain [Pseudocohnilembus persalinus]|uniref:Protein kinase-like domain n=1 Tax=Pseudocohnilembus persalinus TaxID=266149 RepID=A0A0V0QIG1_PSEPJ|nr:Protein kinase-like domain [Pseudocohnilembus persalinus]|eukprot:KRX02009.1 Protein kinase-like domain [Pseudocohnilembus persalinus]